MKSSVLLSLCTAALVAGAAHPKDPQVILKDAQSTFVEPDEYLIELSPGETRLVTEEGKWELRRVWDAVVSKVCADECSKTSTSSTSPTTKTSAQSTAIGSPRRA
jgi:hypothetical protein